MCEFLKLVKLMFRSQTVYSHIQFLVIIISCLVSFGLIQHINVREAFSCLPKFNASMEQLCYDNYTSSYNRVFIGLGVVDGAFCLTWIMFAVYGGVVLRNIKRNRADQMKVWTKAAEYKKIYICGVGLRFKAAFGMILIAGMGVSVPSPFKCPLSNDTATQMLSNQTLNEVNELLCHDERYKAKANLNINLLFVSVFILCLIITELVHLAFTPLDKVLYQALLGVAPTNGEVPVVGFRVYNIQETPRDPVVGYESSVMECNTNNKENTDCEQSHCQTAGTHA